VSAAGAVSARSVRVAAATAARHEVPDANNEAERAERLERGSDCFRRKPMPFRTQGGYSGDLAPRHGQLRERYSKGHLRGLLRCVRCNMIRITTTISGFLSLP
jgi:hypothetical protein